MSELQNEEENVEKVVKGSTTITYINGKIRCKKCASHSSVTTKEFDENEKLRKICKITKSHHRDIPKSATIKEFDENEKLIKLCKRAEYASHVLTGGHENNRFERDVSYINEEVVKENVKVIETLDKGFPLMGRPHIHKVLSTLSFCREGQCAQLVIDSCGEKYFANFENGVPVGDYKMPINLDFSDYFPPEKVGKGWTDSLQALPLLRIRSDKIFSKDCNPLIAKGTDAEGSWKDGKFTGKADSEDFSAIWIDGELKEARLIDDSLGYEDSRDYHWHDGVCDVIICSTTDEGDIVEKKSEYTLRDGKKHGFEKFYNREGIITERKYWQNGKDCTAKYNKLKSIASKRIEKEKQIEAETGIKTRLPKMSKREKMAALRKEDLELSK